MMKDQLTFPAFTHDSIAGYCNDKPLYAQYKGDKKSKYIGTKQMWQELSRLQDLLFIANCALSDVSCYFLQVGALTQRDVVERVANAQNTISHGKRIPGMEY